MTAAKKMKARVASMNEKEKVVIGGEEVSEETLANLSNNKGDDE